MQYFLGIKPPYSLSESVVRLRQLHGWQGMEPHITVKAPCGLAELPAHLPAVRQLCQGIAAFSVEIGGIGSFGSAVLFLRVEAPVLHRLHRSLLQELSVSDADQQACFEGAHYTPHLTLAHQQAPTTTWLAAATSAAEDCFPGKKHFQAVELLVYGKTGKEDYQILEVIPFQGNPPVSSLATLA